VRDLTPRLQRRVHRDFPVDAEFVLATLGDLRPPLLHGGDGERVLAAIVLRAGGDLAQLGRMVELAGVDWRDALVAAGLEHADWPQRLDAELGPAE
jgi:hypothetical protein